MKEPRSTQEISFKTITNRTGIYVEQYGFYDKEGNYYEKEEILSWKPFCKTTNRTEHENS